jgi:hypothetical protein
VSSKVFGSICLCLTLVACGISQQPSDKDSTALCRSLDAEQSGVVIRPVGGTITLARQPFLLRLNDPGYDPGLHVALEPGLSKALLAANSREIWLSAGDSMAGSSGLLIVNGDFKLFNSDSRQNAFVLANGERNASKYGPGASPDISPKLAGQVPKNMQFEKLKNSEAYVYRVQTIDERPIERTSMPALHIVSFIAVQSYPSQQVRMFNRSNWSACTIRFHQ